MNGIGEFLKKLGPARLGAMMAVTLALVGFFGFVALRVSQPAMGVLFTELPFTDTSAIVKELEAKNIRYETRQDGQTILVPRADMAKVRMEMAGKGLPTGGSVGYEIFDKGDAFSATSFVQGINHLRALEGELSRTIRTLTRVQAARVHLVLPEKRIFERDREPPRASIALKVRGELETAQVRAIRHLVASAVEGLKPERVSVVDESGRLLADGAQEAGGAGAAEERQSGFERRMKREIEEIVTSVVGQGRARVQVSTELDFSKVQSTAETFDPESRVVRSTQTRSENSSSTENKDGGVTVANELPGAGRGAAGQGAAGAGNKEAAGKNEEVVNYEISRTTRTETKESGRVKRVSVAVLVDGIYAKAAGGELAYQPRPQEELDRIMALVRTAIGFDKARNDHVEIVNLRFADPPKPVEVAEPPGLMAALSLTKEDLLRGVELAVLAVLTLIVLLTVVRPMVRKVLAPEVLARRIQEAAGQLMGNALDALPGPAGPTRADSAAAKFIEIAKVNGEVQAQSLERIGEVVKTNPQEALAILRQWIHQGA